MRLSLCMIVRDEERDLPLCLESVQGLVDEIIVVDTGSEDRTPQVAREFGAKVYPFRWINDFAAARNESLRHATGDYILWLDADDVIPEEERERFLEWKKDLPERPTAYKFVLESPKEGGDFLNEFCYQLRVFPRLPGVRFIRRIHESVVESLQALKVPIVDYDLRILHRGYSRKEEMERKGRRNLKMLLTALAEDPTDSAVLWHLSMTYNLLGDKERSAHYAELLLKDPTWQRERVWRTAVVCHLGSLYRDLGRREEAERLLQEAIENDPSSPLPLFFLAHLYLKEGDHMRAFKVLKGLREKEIEVSPVPLPPRAIRFYTHLWLGSCYEAMGDRERAAEEYSLASEINPRWEDKGAEIGEFYLRRGDWERALPSLEKAARAGSTDPSLWSNLGVAYRRKGEAEKAEEAYRHALALDPSHFNAISNLAHLLLEEGRVEEAEPFFEEALKREEALDLRLALGYISSLKGEIMGSVEACDRALKALGMTPEGVLDGIEDLARLYLRIALSLQQRKRHREAQLATRTAQTLLQYLSPQPQG
ncbi:MAG: hypothetical protein DRG36_00120 [Deltaproteobacteria bacterium]|nr:MAG: hypothetical protein DRG36_00120 [Deltaproteobacteria bacterium]